MDKTIMPVEEAQGPPDNIKVISKPAAAAPQKKEAGGVTVDKADRKMTSRSRKPEVPR